jgi:propanediol utilization protein
MGTNNALVPDEHLISQLVKAILAELTRQDDNAIPVELSARHVHLSQGDVDRLFGGSLTPIRELSQPHQYLCEEKVRLIGPKGVIDRVAVLGPVRNVSQVEISLTDARSLGIETPLRQSGDIAGSPGVILAAAKGIVSLEQGVIVAGRHIHMPASEAARFGVEDKDRVSVRVRGNRPVIMEDVLVRVSDDFRLAMHIDLDEGNACGCINGTPATIITKDS